MRFYYFQDHIPTSFTAGTKAVKDVAQLLQKAGASVFRVWRIVPADLKFLGPCACLVASIINIVQYLRLYLHVRANSFLFVQYPMQTPHSYIKDRFGICLLRELKDRRGCRVVVLVHDIIELRDPYRMKKGEADTLDNILDIADVYIVHNERMVNWFESRGTPRARLVSLEIFDYLTTYTKDERSPAGSLPQSVVCYAGSLRADFCGFLTRLKEIKDVRWELWGPGYDEEKIAAENIHYNGCCPAEQLPTQMSKGFGLIWYGNELVGCSGMLGEYIKMINPHKLSCCLVAEIPVIVWSKSAAADFVLKYGVGFSIESLEEIPDKIKAITPIRYQEMQANVVRVAQQLRGGYFTLRAVREAVKKLSNDFVDVSPVKLG